MSVTFRGSREGLRITLGEGDWSTVIADLVAQLDRPSAQSFFRGARVLLETGNRSVGIQELEELIALFTQHEMELTSLIGDPSGQQALDRLRGVPDMPPEELEAENADKNGSSDVLVIRRTVRSGQVIKHAGTIVILGDVNPGGELIAEGNVIVWGKLRGVVHAGAAGDANATVGALSLSPTQLRIGTMIARAPDGVGDRTAPAEVARIRDGKIVVEPWGTI
jgi:septum site-determining protein MinC